MAREKIIWVCFKEALSWEDTPGSIREVMVGWLSLGCGKYDSKSFFFPLLLFGGLSGIIEIK
jgi:hypothetical protein